MISTALLLVLLLIATYTDVRWRKIYNWTTYSGIVVGLGTSLLATGFQIDNLNGTESDIARFGFCHLPDSLSGFLACAGVMLVSYVFFAGGVGGGDVKLMAMIGAFTGLHPGIEILLWTFVLGGCMALSMLIWQHGLIWLLVRTTKFVLINIRLGGTLRLTEKEREPLQPELFLSPSALAGYLIVRFDGAAWIAG